MNRVLLAFLLAQSLFGTDLFKSYYNHRFDAPRTEVREVEGLNQRLIDGKLHLRLRDFLELVLKNSAGIQVTRMDVYTSADNIVRSKSPLDPEIILGFNTARSLSPPLYFATTTPTAGAGQGVIGESLISPTTINSLTQNSNVIFNQILPTGQTINTNFNVSRYSGDGYSSPELFGDLSFTITQPLWRNRNAIQYRAPITIARTSLLIASEQSEAAIGNAVANAALQYWDTVLARDNIRVQEQTLALAQSSYERDKKALELGAIAKLDTYQSESTVAERNNNLISARYQYTNALDGLRRLIGADLTPALRNAEIVLEDDPAVVPDQSTILGFEDALTKAFQIRPEMKAAGHSLTVDDLNTRLSRDSLKPRLDLNLQGGATGPGLNQLPTSNNILYPGLPQTLKQVLAFNFPSYGFGLQLTFPLRDSASQASLADSLVSKARDRYTQRQAQEQITLQVRQAINGIELAKATIQAATIARDLARKNVDAERQKYELGVVQAFEYLGSQTSLASAESALLNAYVNYQEAYVNYQYATWTLLDGLGMVVETPKIK